MHDMMQNGGWFGMNSAGTYWIVPALGVVILVLAWALFARRRSHDGTSHSR